MNDRTKTFVFALMLCFGCSMLISVPAVFLKSTQDENIENDRKKNILMAAGLVKAGEEVTGDRIKSLFEKKIEGMVVSIEGELDKSLSPEQLDPELHKNKYVLYKANYEEDPPSYILPVSGKGLWSTIYGYLALESDLNTVKGITFYKHGETPGLGGECEKEWFTSNWKGKKILDKNKKLVSIEVVKGKVADVIKDPSKAIHAVDGISGATITARGIQDFVKSDLGKYSNFFAKLSAKKGEG